MSGNRNVIAAVAFFAFEDREFAREREMVSEVGMHRVVRFLPKLREEALRLAETNEAAELLIEDVLIAAIEMVEDGVHPLNIEQWLLDALVVAYVRMQENSESDS